VCGRGGGWQGRQVGRHGLTSAEELSAPLASTPQTSAAPMFCEHAAITTHLTILARNLLPQAAACWCYWLVSLGMILCVVPQLLLPAAAAAAAIACCCNLGGFAALHLATSNCSSLALRVQTAVWHCACSAQPYDGWCIFVVAALNGNCWRGVAAATQ
jgi:hypothetical protein